eukprot:14146646-Heterocapsa_arctica.AAC.1
MGGRMRGHKAVAKRLPSACHVPGIVVCLELKANTLFHGRTSTLDCCFPWHYKKGFHLVL